MHPDSVCRVGSARRAGPRRGARIAAGMSAVRSLGALVCGESTIERLTQEQLGELAVLLEPAVCGKVSRWGRPHPSWQRERRVSV